MHAEDAAVAAAAVAAAAAGSYRSWNSNRPCFYEFSSNTFAQDPKNADIDLERVLQLTRSSVIHADLLHNSWHQRLKAMGKRLIAVQGKRRCLMHPGVQHAVVLS
jgi:hypothetical protein